METQVAIDLFLNAHAFRWHGETPRHYRKVLSHFARVCPRLPTTPEEIEAYYAIRKQTATTLVDYDKRLRYLYRFLERRYRRPNPMHLVYRPEPVKKERRVLDEQEQLFMVELARQTDRRDYAILLFFLDTMARVSELSGVRHSDIIGNPTTGYRIRLNGKTGEHIVKLPIKTREAMLGLGNNEYIFISKKTGKPLGRHGIEYRVNRYLQAAGLKEKGQSCHLLRHTAATWHQLRGGNPLELRDRLGHKSLAMTDRYVHMAQRIAHNSGTEDPFGFSSNLLNRNNGHHCDKCGGNAMLDGDALWCPSCGERPLVRREG